MGGLQLVGKGSSGKRRQPPHFRLLLVLLTASVLALRGRYDVAFAAAPALLFAEPRLQAQDARVASRVPRPASLGQALEEAPPERPKDWIRLSTAATSESAADRIVQAIGTVSQGLAVELDEVKGFRSGQQQADGHREWTIAVWVPPKAMLLVSSMMGEAQDDAEIPMVLVEGLEGLDGDTDDAVYVRGILTNPSAETLEGVARDAVAKRYVGHAHVGTASDGAKLWLETTATGRSEMDSWLASQGLGDIDWAALGGNQEYLETIAANVVQKTE
eukprot:TRINITY_DN66774_c0_g1_i1.p1 TRINITY_DN66774_c0_g1~~TRINITY_DN66774_c0_g1_i1.p1  ORF type:complete len:274 (+),score=63.76 TRINITY_DN66774_c0_g1_i1:51-872(+)